MKKLITIIILVAVLIMSNAMVFASGSLPFTVSEMKVGLVIDGTITTWNETNLGRLFTTDKGRAMMPVRAIAEILDFMVQWNEQTQTVTLSKDEKEIAFPIGATEIQTPNGLLTMEIPAVVINGRTMVPVRFASEALGVQVEWKSHRNVTGSSNYAYDYYVVLTTGNKPVEVFNPLNFDENPEVMAVIESLPSTVKKDVDSTQIIIGQDNMINADMAYLDVYKNTYSEHGDVNEMYFQILNWTKEGVQESLLGLLKVYAGKDGQEVFAKYVYGRTNDIPLDTWFKASGGTEYKFLVGRGVTIIVNLDSPF